MSKDKKPQQPKNTDKILPLYQKLIHDNGGRAYDDIDNREEEVTRRPTPLPHEDEDE